MPFLHWLQFRNTDERAMFQDLFESGRTSAKLQHEALMQELIVSVVAAELHRDEEDNHNYLDGATLDGATTDDL